MINLTGSAIILKYGSELSSSMNSVVERLLNFATVHEPFPVDYQESVNRQLRRRHSFSYVFRPLHTGGFYSNKDVEAIITLATTLTAASEEAVQAYITLSCQKPKYTEDVDGLRILSRALMIGLWAEGAVVLPHGFPRKGVDSRIPGYLETTDPSFVRDILQSSEASPSVQRYGRAFFYSTDWKLFADVSFDEAWDAIPLLAKLCKSSDFSRNPFPLTAVIETISQKHPTLIPREKSELLKSYFFSQLKQTYETTPPSQLEFQNYISLPEKKRLRVRDLKSRDRAKSNNTPLKLSIDEFFCQSTSLSGKRSSDLSWLKDGWYPSRDHISLDEIAAHWLPIIKAYYDHIKGTQSRQTFRQVRTELNLLWDYIFCYLPWWIEENPTSRIQYPYEVSDFTRHLFWKRATKSGLLPKTALDMYLARRSRKTASNFVRRVKDFFDFAIGHSEEFRELSDSFISADFENPINEKDSPGSGPRTPSDKLAIPFSCISFIRNYFLALDDIGCELQNLAFSETHKELLEQASLHEWIDLEKLGISVSFDFFTEEREHSTTLTRIPNIFNWHKGLYFNGKSSESVKMPWLSCLRMLMAEFYCGQRMQNFQWLNIDSFDAHATGEESYYSLIQLEHDKTAPGRYIRIQNKIMKILQREKKFQLTTYTEEVSKVHYENHEADGSIKFRPLFRSPFTDNSNGSLPFSDNTYHIIWRKFLAGVQTQFNETVEPISQYAFFKIEDDDEIDKSTGLPLKNLTDLKPRHTPHSMRNTYITWMSRLTDMEIIQEQAGHKSIRVTYHYFSPGAEYIDSELAKADDLIMRGSLPRAQATIFSGQTIKPSSINSGLRRGLEENLQGTIFDQQMFSIESDNIICKKTGTTLIRLLPTTSFAVFNHCICPLGGICPKEVMDVTRHQHRCGICPIAVFSADNAEAIEAKRRQLHDHIDGLKTHLTFLRSRNEPKETIERFEMDLKLSSLELVGYTATAKVIKANLEKQAKEKYTYICRAPEIAKKAFSLTSDYGVHGQRVLSKLADANAFPEYASPDYLSKLNRSMRNGQWSTEIGDYDPIKIACDHVASLMKAENLSFAELSKSNSASVLIEVHNYE